MIIFLTKIRARSSGVFSRLIAANAIPIVNQKVEILHRLIIEFLTAY